MPESRVEEASNEYEESESRDARAAEGWGRRTEKREEEKERKRGGAM